MSFFSKKKQSQPNTEDEEPIVINSENKIVEGTPSSFVSEIQSKTLSTNDQTLKTSPSATVHETNNIAPTEYEYPEYSYSTSVLESISFDLYSESTKNEIKKGFDKTYSFFKKSWICMKDVYTYVSVLSEECIINEMKQQQSKNDIVHNIFIESGLDVSI